MIANYIKYLKLKIINCRLVVMMGYPDNVYLVSNVTIRKKINGNQCLICRHVAVVLVLVF